ncbi:hypothetical protein [Spirulina subsalsa]|uniref:hypothetical protein n=1 Tax=Spirulina subsalsa TaxID=54311 RepID=UPI000373C63B|nr:hypothetical protein [Spirulina subsalsa]
MPSSLIKSLSILGLTLGSLSWSLPALALDFSFSFQSVSGTITGVPPGGGGASQVTVTNSPIGGSIGNYGGGGTFNISGGNISSANFTGTFGGNTLTFSATNGSLGGISGPVTFSPLGAAAAPWDFNPTVALLVGAGVWAVASRRKKGRQTAENPAPTTLIPNLSSSSSDGV